MKTIKAYKYGLNHLLILDTENKTRQLVYMERDFETDDTTRITKATINKYRKDYEKNRWNTYVITSPILANFSNDEEERELHKQKANSIFVGEYESIEELKQDIKEMYDATQVIRKENHFVNFESSLLEVLNSFIVGEQLKDEKEIEIAKAIKERKMKKLLDDFNNEYDFLYSNSDRVAGYDEAVKAFDEFLATTKGRELIQKFVTYRGDIISSDREAAAFMFAL